MPPAVSQVDVQREPCPTCGHTCRIIQRVPCGWCGRPMKVGAGHGFSHNRNRKYCTDTCRTLACRARRMQGKLSAKT